MASGDPLDDLDSPAGSTGSRMMRSMRAAMARLQTGAPAVSGEAPAINGHYAVAEGADVVDDDVVERDAAETDDGVAPEAGSDPLLANGNGRYGEPEATIIEAPPHDPVDEPVVDRADAVPIAATVAISTAAVRTPVGSGPAVRRQRVRPALPLLRRRPRVRKVTRIVRRVDAWTVFKISLVFYVVLFIILLVAGVLLWNLANTTGTVANVEGFIRDLFGLKTFNFDGEKMFRASWVLGAILVIAGTGINVTMAVLFNLIADIVGGVRVTVLEEEVILRERPVVARPAEQPEPAPPAVAATNGHEPGPVTPPPVVGPDDLTLAEPVWGLAPPETVDDHAVPPTSV